MNTKPQLVAVTGCENKLEKQFVESLFGSSEEAIVELREKLTPKGKLKAVIAQIESEH